MLMLVGSTGRKRFFWKKKQNSRKSAYALRQRQLYENQSFLVLFFKKERLALPVLAGRRVARNLTET